MGAGKSAAGRKKSRGRRSLKTCLLSSHPFFLNVFQKLMSGNKLAPVARRVDMPDSNSHESSFSLPKASVYIIDGQNQPRSIAAMIAYIREYCPQSHLLVIAETFRDETAFPLLGSGVKGLLSYAEAAQQLPRAVEAVAEGGYWVPRELLSRFVESLIHKPRGTDRRPQMRAAVSRREQEILNGLLENRSNKEIANALNISERTVKFHVSNLLAKSGVQRRADLILLAFQDQVGASPSIQ